MSEEDLELLITLDDPWNAQECDTFYDHQAEHTVTYWPVQPDPTRGGDTTVEQKPLLIMTPTRSLLVRAIGNAPYQD